MVQPKAWRNRTERNDMLELQSLTRRYGDLVALDDLSFSVAEGQMFGFVGPNGAGKTTAMRIVLGVLEADRGEVRWRGRPMNHEGANASATCRRTTDKRFLCSALGFRATAAAHPRSAQPAGEITGMSKSGLRGRPSPGSTASQRRA
jgi:ABC-type cobalamin/Fe3+-siderophores transport system ATPase subunit